MRPGLSNACLRGSVSRGRVGSAGTVPASSLLEHMAAAPLPQPQHAVCTARVRVAHCHHAHRRRVGVALGGTCGDRSRRGVPHVRPPALALPLLRRTLDRRAARLLDVRKEDVRGRSGDARARERAASVPAPVPGAVGLVQGISGLRLHMKVVACVVESCLATPCNRYTPQRGGNGAREWGDFRVVFCRRVANGARRIDTTGQRDTSDRTSELQLKLILERHRVLHRVDH